MSSIRNTSLLYRPSLSVWTARKLDKNESAKVNKDAGAVEGAANVHKHLLPECAELEAIQKWAGAFRTFVYTSTLPWDDSGWRIGSVVRHMDFMAECGDRIRTGEALVDDFARAYSKALDAAKFQLNHLWSASDYPGVNEMRAKFRFVVDVQPMPASDDFRVVDGVPQAEVDRLVQVAQDHVQARVGEAMKEAYRRLYEVVAKMANTLEQYGNKTVKKFNDSLVENIAEIVAVMPALNLTKDPHLEALASEAKQLALYSAMDLRRDEHTREAAIQDARALAVKFKGVVAEASLPPPLATKPEVPQAPRLVLTAEQLATIPTIPASSAQALFADML